VSQRTLPETSLIDACIQNSVSHVFYFDKNKQEILKMISHYTTVTPVHLTVPLNMSSFAAKKQIAQHLGRAKFHFVPSL
jgi:hypothetical protein